MKIKFLLLLCFAFLFIGCQAEEPVEPTAPPTEVVVLPTDTPAPTAVPTATPIATPNPMPVYEDEGWQLVWSDEFDGDSLNPAN